VRVRRLEHDEADPGAPGQRRQSTESIGERSGRGRRRLPGVARQVDDQQVDRSTGEERARDRQALVGIGRCQHDEPLRLDAASHDLDRVEGRREVQPGDDRTRSLCRGREPQRERGPAARRVAAQGDAHATRHAAGTENGVELGEPGREGTSDRGPAELASVLGERVAILA
jgi:hypothetical protein